MNALDKVCAMLEAFLPDGDGLRLSDLCKATGLSKSTASVIANSLTQRGYLSRSGKRGVYLLGVKFIEFAYVVHQNLRVGEIALPYLQQLCAQLDETTELAVRDGNYAAVLESVRSRRLLSGTGRWAARVSLRNTACGKVLAAFMDPTEWRAIRDSLEPTGGTAKTLPTLHDLERELKNVRRERFAIDDEEVELGIRSVAAPVFEATGEVCAALYIVGPKTRITNAVMAEYTALVQEYAVKVSKEMGYTERGAVRNASPL